ncbi:MAG: hypothetical protein IJL03_03235 [Lachnospiraceae bacterium]|nr:hypothetical protein [Lachnospiraceae bacterium]
MNGGEWGIKQTLLVAIIGGVIFPVIILLVLPHADATEKEYVENGVLTRCFVETVVSVNNKQQVVVVYTDANGKQVKAKGILNKHVTAGEYVEAYVLASKPNEVFFPASKFLKIIFFIIAGLIAVGSWIPFIIMLRRGKIDNLAEQARAMNQKWNN